MITIRIGASKSDIPTTERDHKGKSLLKAVSDYVVLDLETTGLDPARDQIIEVGALRVRDGQTVDSFQSLVKPSYPIDEFITELTGITNAMLETAPNIRDVLPALMAFIGEDIVMGHNVNFDVNFIYDNCERQGLPSFSNDFVDTMRISRRLYPQERHHRLCDITERLSIHVPSAHRALADVETTKACYDAMLRNMETRGITMDDIKPTDKWFNMSDRIAAKTDQFDPNTAIYGRTFVFTGALDDMPRKDAMQLVVDLGGLCDDTVNKNTNYLVLGNQGYSIALKDGKSSKHKKAEKLQAKGADIQIISESVFYEMVREAQHSDSKDESTIKANSNQMQLPHDPFTGIEKMDVIEIWSRGDDYRKAERFDEALALFNMAKDKGYCAPALYESYSMLYRKTKEYEKELNALDEGITVMIEHNYRTDRLMMRRQKAAELLEKSRAEQAAALEKQRQKEEQRQARLAAKAAEKEAAKANRKPRGRAILQMNDDMTIIRRFDNIADAERETGINSKCITDTAKGIQKHAGGYVWRYEDTL